MRCINCIHSYTFKWDGELDLACDYLDALDIEPYNDRHCFCAEREPELSRRQSIKSLAEKREFERRRGVKV